MARRHFAAACDLQAKEREAGAAPDPYVMQQLALTTYKSNRPDARTALQDAWKVIQTLNPEMSTDPETLGIAGAIQKRLYGELGDRAYLEKAVELYGRGFEIKRDYYNGENYAACLDIRAPLQDDAAETDYDRRTAGKVRQRIVASLTAALAEPQAKERPDYTWMLATMANTQLALGLPDAADFEKQFRGRVQPGGWEEKTFDEGRLRALAARAVQPCAF